MKGTPMRLDDLLLLDHLTDAGRARVAGWLVDSTDRWLRIAPGRPDAPPVTIRRTAVTAWHVLEPAPAGERIDDPTPIDPTAWELVDVGLPSGRVVIGWRQGSATV